MLIDADDHMGLGTELVEDAQVMVERGRHDVLAIVRPEDIDDLVDRDKAANRGPFAGGKTTVRLTPCPSRVRDEARAWRRGEPHLPIGPLAGEPG